MSNQLYSYQGGAPAPLPRVHTHDGREVTRLHTYVPEQLEAWGFLPVDPAPDTKRGEFAVWRDGEWTVERPDANPDAVREESDRRVLAGVSITLADGTGPIAVSGQREDREKLHALATVANSKIVAGDTTTIQLLTGDGQLLSLSPNQVNELFRKSVDYIEALTTVEMTYRFSGQPIPWDFYDDANWPSSVI